MSAYTEHRYASAFMTQADGSRPGTDASSAEACLDLADRKPIAQADHSKSVRPVHCKSERTQATKAAYRKCLSCLSGSVDEVTCPHSCTGSHVPDPVIWKMVPMSQRDPMDAWYIRRKEYQMCAP